MKRLGFAVESELGLEAVDLSSVAVAADRDVENAEVPLVVATIEDLVGEEDHSGTRAEHGQTVAETFGDRVEQCRRPEQVRHRRRFSPGHHQGVHRRQLGRRSDLDGVRADGAQPVNVSAKRSLQGKNADRGQIHLGAPGRPSVHQPRSAKRWDSGTSSIPMPVIGAPRPRLTLARIAASA